MPNGTVFNADGSYDPNSPTPLSKDMTDEERRAAHEANKAARAAKDAAKKAARDQKNGV